MKYLGRYKRQLIAIGIFIVLFFVLTDLNTRLTEYFRLSDQRNDMRTVVAQLDSTRAYLQTQIVFATSEAAVDEWARQQAHMVKPGDKLVVVVPKGSLTPVPESAQAPTPQAVENWQVWWALFFGD